MLPVVFEEFELVCVLFFCFTIFFSFHYHSQLLKDQLQQKSEMLQPPASLPLSFYRPVVYYSLKYQALSFLVMKQIKLLNFSINMS